jgi:PadR family transcriptional regulator PadR
MPKLDLCADSLVRMTPVVRRPASPCQTRRVCARLLGRLGSHYAVGKTAELLPGTLDMLILKAVSLKPLHGYGVLLRIRQISRDALEIPQGSLYPALYRLEHHDLIAAEWGQSENNRRAKYYTLTPAGRRRLRDETAGWNRLASAIAAALSTTSEKV